MRSRTPLSMMTSYVVAASLFLLSALLILSPNEANAQFNSCEMLRRNKTACGARPDECVFLDWPDKFYSKKVPESKRGVIGW